MKATLLWVAVAVLGWSGARAEEVDRLGAKVSELDERVNELDRLLRPPAAPSADIADRRLVDAQVLYELRNYDAASIILFDIVDKYPNTVVYPEALYYLADSLYQRRDYLSSRRYFAKILDVGPRHPRYQESLERLIELSLHTGDYTPVDDYIHRLEGLPTDKQLPSVPYVEGKYFFFRQQYDKALAVLKTIGPTNMYYFHALYFMGAANVAMGGEHLPAALEAFGTILKTDAKTDAQKRIVELAHMAMARVYMDRGRFSEALQEYAWIHTTSDLFADALYESAWVSIKSKQYQKAARALDLILLAEPDSPMVPEIKLLIGQLQIQVNAFGPASDAFTRTRDEYGPIHKQLDDLLKSQADPTAYFRELIAKNLVKFDTAAILPSGAIKFLKDEPQVARVKTLIGDEAELNRSLDDSEEIVRRLDRALSGPGRVNAFPDLASARARAIAISNELTLVKQQLAAREAQLITPVAGDLEQQLKQMERERDRLEESLRALPINAESIAERQRKAREAIDALDKQVVELQTQLTGQRASAVATAKFLHDEVAKTLSPEEAARLRAQIEDLLKQIEAEGGDGDKLRHDLADAATGVGVDDADMQAAQQRKAAYDDLLRRLNALGAQVRARLSPSERNKAEQLASIMERAHGVETKLTEYNQRIDKVLGERLQDVESQLNDERAHVIAYRNLLAGYTGESVDVGGGIVAENFKTVTQRFYNIVVRADVGIIDVAWALKDQATKETNRLVSERKRELKLLDDEFKEVLKDQP